MGTTQNCQKKIEENANSLIANEKVLLPRPLAGTNTFIIRRGSCNL